MARRRRNSSIFGFSFRIRGLDGRDLGMQFALFLMAVWFVFFLTLGLFFTANGHHR
jgi:hypothetical protein